jgi:hypothetical protein
MKLIKADEARENRIMMEAVVDCYDAGERAMGWYYYLDDKLRFPFTAKCVARREISPLEPGDEIEVLAMASEDECGREMFVRIRWGKRGLAVPLAQLEPVSADSQTEEGVGDWHYWLKRGYVF